MPPVLRYCGWVGLGFLVDPVTALSDYLCQHHLVCWTTERPWGISSSSLYLSWQCSTWLGGGNGCQDVRSHQQCRQLTQKSLLCTRHCATQSCNYKLKPSTREELYSGKARVEGSSHEKANYSPSCSPISMFKEFPRFPQRKQDYCNKHHLSPQDDSHSSALTGISHPDCVSTWEAAVPDTTTLLHM